MIEATNQFVETHLIPVRRFVVRRNDQFSKIYLLFLEDCANGICFCPTELLSVNRKKTSSCILAPLFYILSHNQ